MIDIYPNAFDKFKCIAKDCEDSCCKGWDIVIDDESYVYYKNVKGPFGERLNEVTTIDSDGDRIFVSQNGKCPFWNRDKLCDIYINLGEERLCKTCTAFPRIVEDYGEFREHILSFACPEGARLMLNDCNSLRQNTTIDCVYENDDYDYRLMNFLLKARVYSLKILEDNSNSFRTKLIKLLSYNNMVQKCLDSDDLGVVPIPYFDNMQSNKKSSFEFIFALHRELEIMNSEWSQILNDAEKHCNDFSGRYDDKFTILSKYYIYRYYLTGVSDYDVLSTIKRILCGYVVINGILNTGIEDLTKPFYMYSKEVEHSYDNSEKLVEEFYTDSNFSVDNLIGML